MWCVFLCVNKSGGSMLFSLFFVSINKRGGVTYWKTILCCVFFFSDSRTHLCNDHVLSGSQGRHLLCIDTIPNLSAPPPKDTGEISFMLIHLTFFFFPPFVLWTVYNAIFLKIFVNHPTLLKEEEKKKSVLELAQVRSSLVFKQKKTSKEQWFLFHGPRQSERRLHKRGWSANWC